MKFLHARTMSAPAIVCVGLGNVGLHLALGLALLLRRGDGGARPAVALLDHDRVGPRDVAKGYHDDLVGTRKADAALIMIARCWGQPAAAPFTALVAAAQGAPGLIRAATVVFNGTDSARDAAAVSELARNGWEARLSTGYAGMHALHAVEICPPGYALFDFYDDAALSDVAHRDCGGNPVNSAAGVPQPSGAVSAALALEQYCARAAGERPRLIRVNAGAVSQFPYQSRPPLFSGSAELPLTQRSALADLFGAAAEALGASPGDLRLTFTVPLVDRRCRDGCAPPGIGFERQPVHGRCPACGEPSFVLSSLRDTTLAAAAAWRAASRTLRELGAPAGMGFTALRRDGGEAAFHLPFDPADLPPLQEPPRARQDDRGRERRFVG